MWSSGFVGARLGTDEAPPDTLLAWRYLVVVVLLLAWTGVRGGWAPRGTRMRHGAVGLLTQGGYLGGIVTGVALGVPAGVAALIAALQPPLVGAVAGRILGEHVGRRQWVGIGLGLAGVTLVVAGDLGRGSAPPAAYLLPVAGMVALSAGTLLERRWQVRGSLLGTMTIHCVAGAAFFVGIAAAGDRLSPPATGQFWAAVAWVVVLSHLGGYGFYLAVLRRGGATRVSTLLYLTPPTTMVWAFAMFGDPVSPGGVAGLVVCGGAVWLFLSASHVPCPTSPTEGGRAAAGAMDVLRPRGGCIVERRGRLREMS